MNSPETKRRLQHYLSRLQLEDAIPEHLFPLMQIRTYAPGDFLCRCGEPVPAIWIILEGRCRVLSLSPQGKMVVIAQLEPGEFCGEMEIFSGDTFLQSVEAQEETITLVLQRDLVVGEMFQNPNFLLFLCKRFAKKAKEASSRYATAMLYPLNIRVAQYLLYYSQVNGMMVLQMRAEDLSQQFGTTVRHLRRILSELEDAGLIARAGNSTTVADVDGLKAMVSAAME